MAAAPVAPMNLTIQLQGGEQDLQNVDYIAKLTEAWTLVSNHSNFDNIQQATPLSLAEGGAQVPYKHSDYLLALGGTRREVQLTPKVGSAFCSTGRVLLRVLSFSCIVAGQTSLKGGGRVVSQPLLFRERWGRLREDPLTFTSHLLGLSQAKIRGKREGNNTRSSRFFLPDASRNPAY